MKRHFRLVLGLLVLLSATVLQAQTPAAKPGPEHEKLMKIWVGDSTYESESFATPLGPAGKVVGKVTVRPMLGGFFVEMRGEEKGPAGTFSWFEVDGYDALNKRFFWSGFGSDGSIASVTYTIDGTKMDYSGTLISGEKQCKIWGTVVFAADFMSWVEKRELSLDGQTWMPSFQSKAIKTKK
jgi:hypothetical protein